MVSLRCKNLVRVEMDLLGINYSRIDLGMVEIPENISKKKRDQLKKELLSVGLELMEDERSLMVERINNLITEMIFYSDSMPEESYSDFIAKKLNTNYTYLAALYSEVNGMTIQKFIIHNKIERIKELLIYTNLSLKEISYKLQYSSVAHLSNQFKKWTGLTPSFFRQISVKRNLELEKMASI